LEINNSLEIFMKNNFENKDTKELFKNKRGFAICVNFNIEKFYVLKILAIRIKIGNVLIRAKGRAMRNIYGWEVSLHE